MEVDLPQAEGTHIAEETEQEHPLHARDITSLDNIETLVGDVENLEMERERHTHRERQREQERERERERDRVRFHWHSCSNAHKAKTCLCPHPATISHTRNIFKNICAYNVYRQCMQIY